MKAVLILAAALSIGAIAPASAAEPVPPRFASPPAPAEKFDIGGMLVERHGERGRPLILIPGLGSGPWVWDAIIKEFKGEHVIYAVTLPGFNGRPAAAGAPVTNSLQALRDLVKARSMKAPVLIGHSLGATLALNLAQDDPSLVGGVIAIDGLPVFPGTEQAPKDQRVAIASGMKARMAGMTRESYAAQQRNYMRTIGSIDMARADDIALMSSKSDPVAVMDYMAAIVELDLRDRLSRIKAPVLVLVPYFAPDGEYAQVNQVQKMEYYKSLMAGTPKLELVPVTPARHFAMLDQPEQVAKAIRSFLGPR